MHFTWRGGGKSTCKARVEMESCDGGNNVQRHRTESCSIPGANSRHTFIEQAHLTCKSPSLT